MFLFYCCKHSNDSMLVNKKQFCKHSSCKTKECYTSMELNPQPAMGEKVFSWRENSEYIVNENTTKSEKMTLLDPSWAQQATKPSKRYPTSNLYKIDTRIFGTQQQLLLYKQAGRLPNWTARRKTAERRRALDRGRAVVAATVALRPRAAVHRA